MNGGFVTITYAERKPRKLTFGSEVNIEELNPSVKEVEQPQIQPEMPEAIAEVQEVLAAPPELSNDSKSVHHEIIQPPRRKRGRPKKETKDEH